MAYLVHIALVEYVDFNLSILIRISKLSPVVVYVCDIYAYCDTGSQLQLRSQT